MTKDEYQQNDKFILLPLDFQIVKEKVPLIKVGLTPKGMDDRWKILYQKNKLLFIRSWTGTYNYVVNVEENSKGLMLKDFYVNRIPHEYTCVDDAYDTKMVRFLIEYLLLKMDVDFPTKDCPEDLTVSLICKWQSGILKD